MAKATTLLEPQIDVSQPILEVIASFWYEAFLTRISDEVKVLRHRPAYLAGTRV